MQATGLAAAIAAHQYRLYSFVGKLKKDNYTNLHVTSHQFSEKQCVDYIKDCKIVLAIHGLCDGPPPNATEWTESTVGGLARQPAEAGWL
ncbi:poly-gamma-glutamate hydrolase family protein [Phyllobacterium sp. LjRoot231]|uniref:poly-gamma-glutamate hydrolase family protein n=1 Tax=Phyllobacterium sp. LjRoot231 TaxID=3342289 RepID=UPI003F509101